MRGEGDEESKREREGGRNGGGTIKREGEKVLKRGEKIRKRGKGKLYKRETQTDKGTSTEKNAKQKFLSRSPR